jgi:hypothetical protein
VTNDLRKEADSLLDRLEDKFGLNEALRAKLRPLILRILESTPPNERRKALLRLVIEIYAQQMRLAKTVQRLQARLHSRLNEAYGQILGIEPPHVG